MNSENARQRKADRLAMWEVLRQRDFSLLLIGQVISAIGDWVRITALPFYAYELTGSATITGTLFVTQLLPGLFLSSLAGVFVDRWNRKSTLIVCDILRAVLVPFFLLARSADTVWILYVVAFLSALVSLFFVPAKFSLIPLLVGKRQLGAANSLDALSDNIARLIGPLVGGGLLGVVGLSGVVVLDSASFLVSALFLSFMGGRTAPVPAVEGAPADVSRRRGTGWGSEWIEGLRLLSRNRRVLWLFLVQGISTFGDSILTALLVVFVKDGLKVGAAEFGWLLTARGLGGMLGGFVIGHTSSNVRAARLVGLGLLSLGLIFLVIVNVPSFWLTLVLLVIVGLPAMAWLVGAQILLQTSTTDEYRGRVFGAYTTVISLTMLAGMGLGSTLADVTGATVMLNVAACLYLVAAIASLPLLLSPADVAEEAAEELDSA